MSILYDIMEVAIYSVLGIALMMLGNFLIDLIIPCSFPEEIKRGNKAIGFVSAGTNIGVGMLLKAAISSPAASSAKESLLVGIGGSVLYFVIGIAFFMIGYLVIRFFNKQYNLNDEVGCGNTAAGIMVAGIFIGLANVISGVIA
jgi:putative membrane protein